MIVQFDRSFSKCLGKLNDQNVKAKLIEIIKELEQIETIKELNSVKKLQGFKNYYRIRIGDYRLGFELIDNKIVLLIIIVHRKDIYKKFPR